MTAPAPEEDFREQDASNVADTMNITSGILTIISMISGSKAQQAYANAGDGADADAKRKKATAKHAQAETMQLDAAALAIHSETVGSGVADIAHRNEFIGTLVGHLETVNGVAGIGVAMLPLVYQIILNHAPAEARDNAPPQLMEMGVLPPKMLMEKLQATNAVKVARMQTDLLREKQQAEQELEELRAELEDELEDEEPEP